MAYKLRNDVDVANILSAKRTIPTVANALPTWVTLTPYILGDYVEQSNKIYKCLIAHTAGTFATDLTANNWVEISAGGNSVLGYDVTSAYVSGDQRIYRSVLIQANNAITANTAFAWGTTGATWKPVTPTGYTWQGVWAVGTAYLTNAVVVTSTTSNDLYFAVIGNTGNDPGSNGNPFWNDYRYIDFDNFAGASTSLGGRPGLVPQPFAGQTDGFLRSDGLFSVPALGTLLVTNKPVGGNLHTTSTTTPDYIDRYVVTQTTPGQIMTVANASATYNRGRLIYVQNSSSSTTSFTIYGKSLAPGKFVPLYWNGTTWIPLVIDATSITVIEDLATLSTLTPTDKDVVFVQGTATNTPQLFIYDSGTTFGDVNPSTNLTYTVTFNSTTDLVTTSVPHTLIAGTPIRFSDTAPANPLSTNPTTTTYFVINPTATTFQVATTVGGSAIDFLSNGSGVNTHYVSTLGTWLQPRNKVADTFKSYGNYNNFQTDTTTVFNVGDFINIVNPFQILQVKSAGTGFANILTQNLRRTPQGLELSNGFQFSTSFTPDVVKFGHNYYGAIFSSSAQPLVIGLMQSDGGGYLPAIGEKVQFVIFNTEPTDKVVQFDPSWKDSTGTAITNQTVPANSQIRIDFDGVYNSGLTEYRQIVSSTNAINTWVASTTYKAKDTVKLNGVVYQRISAGTSGTTFDGTEAATWNIISIDSTTNTFAATTYYPVGQSVEVGNKIVERVSAGVSAATFTNTEAALWKMISQKDFQSTWTASTYYYQGEKITFEGRTLQKLASGLSGATFNATEAALWTPVTPLKFGSPWVATTYYYQGDVVYYSPNGTFLERGTNGMSLATFNNIESSAWTLVSINDTLTWTASTYYQTGVEVSYANKILQQVTGQTSNATFDSLESAKWLLTASRLQPWIASTYYYANEQVTNNGIIYQKIAGSVSTATFDSTEEALWNRTGTLSSNPKTITAATYTVLATDSVLSLDSTANNINVTFPATLPEGKFYTIQYQKTSNSITFTAGGGSTIVDPSSYTATSSFVASGSVGQIGSTQFFRVGTIFNFLG